MSVKPNVKKRLAIFISYRYPPRQVLLKPAAFRPVSEKMDRKYTPTLSCGDIRTARRPKLKVSLVEFPRVALTAASADPLHRSKGPGLFARLRLKNARCSSSARHPSDKQPAVRGFSYG